jgi:hypothetical protein
VPAARHSKSINEGWPVIFKPGAKSGVTQELRSLARANLVAEARQRRRTIAMSVTAVIAVCVFLVLRWLL